MIKFELIGDKVSYEGQLFKNIPTASRHILSLNKKDQPFQAFRGDMLCLHGSSIKWMAARDVVDESSGKRRGERYVKHRR